jgi:transcriptional regulator with XRE-family HTH domain
MPRPRIYGDQFQENFQKLRNQGKSTKEIATELGMNPASMIKLLNRRGIYVVDTIVNPSIEIKIDYIFTELKKLTSFRRICRDIGINHEVVRRYLKDRCELPLPIKDNYDLDKWKNYIEGKQNGN